VPSAAAPVPARLRDRRLGFENARHSEVLAADQLRRDALERERGHQEHEVVGTPRDVQNFRCRRRDLARQRHEVGGPGRVGFREHDLTAKRAQTIAESERQRLAIAFIREQDRGAAALEIANRQLGAGTRRPSRGGTSWNTQGPTSAMPSSETTFDNSGMPLQFARAPRPASERLHAAQNRDHAFGLDQATRRRHRRRRFAPRIKPE
jgi:hypothetical protein